MTRPGCELCDEALARVLALTRWFPLEVEVLDITTNPDLEDEYHLRIPVLLDRRDTVLAEGQFDQLVAVVIRAVFR